MMIIDGSSDRSRHRGTSDSKIYHMSSVIYWQWCDIWFLWRHRCDSWHKNDIKPAYLSQLNSTNHPPKWV